jgi:HSP20 family protein
MIKNLRYYSKPACIYPGIYQPLQDKEPELTNEEDVGAAKPPVNIIDQPDHYRIEVFVPDFSKSDFIITTNRCSLSIAAKKINKIKTVIDLPADADTDFGTAEYKNGMLYIYLYRSSCPVQNRQSQIIVY